MNYQRKLRGLVLSTGLAGMIMHGMIDESFAQTFNQSPPCRAGEDRRSARRIGAPS